MLEFFFNTTKVRDQMLGALSDAIRSGNPSAIKRVFEDLVNEYIEDPAIEMPVIKTLAALTRKDGCEYAAMEAAILVGETSPSGSDMEARAFETILALACNVAKKRMDMALDGLELIIDNTEEGSRENRIAVETVLKLAEENESQHWSNIVSALIAAFYAAPENSWLEMKTKEMLSSIALKIKDYDSGTAAEAAETLVEALPEEDNIYKAMDKLLDELEEDANYDEAPILPPEKFHPG